MKESPRRRRPGSSSIGGCGSGVFHSANSPLTANQFQPASRSFHSSALSSRALSLHASTVPRLFPCHLKIAVLLDICIPQLSVLCYVKVRCRQSPTLQLISPVRAVLRPETPLTLRPATPPWRCRTPRKPPRRRRSVVGRRWHVSSVASARSGAIAMCPAITASSPTSQTAPTCRLTSRRRGSRETRRRMVRAQGRREISRRTSCLYLRPATAARTMPSHRPSSSAARGRSKPSQQGRRPVPPALSLDRRLMHPTMLTGLFPVSIISKRNLPMLLPSAMTTTMPHPRTPSHLRTSTAQCPRRDTLAAVTG